MTSKIGIAAKRSGLVEYSEIDGCVSFAVRVIPRSSKTEIVGELNGALKIKLASPPVEGSANDELIKLLARAFGVSKSKVEIISGLSSKIKKVRINETDATSVASILQPKS